MKATNAQRLGTAQNTLEQKIILLSQQIIDGTIRGSDEILTTRRLIGEYVRQVGYGNLSEKAKKLSYEQVTKSYAKQIERQKQLDKAAAEKAREEKLFEMFARAERKPTLPETKEIVLPDLQDATGLAEKLLGALQREHPDEKIPTLGELTTRATPPDPLKEIIGVSLAPGKDAVEAAKKAFEKLKQEKNQG